MLLSVFGFYSGLCAETVSFVLVGWLPDSLRLAPDVRVSSRMIAMMPTPTTMGGTSEWGECSSPIASPQQAISAP
jgi:hypothetical protein